MSTIQRNIYLAFNRMWYQKPNVLTYLLLPLSFIFLILVLWRRWLYQHHFLKSVSMPVPVIVVGNITVGGTGKTPFIIGLAHDLIQKGYRSGIISRGYGGDTISIPREVIATSNPQEVGDEPVLIARHVSCPIVVCNDRVKAAQTLLSLHPECAILLSDDGLQHYRLARNIEIVVVDSQRLWGNGYCLPAGPLRENVHRIQSCNCVIMNGHSEMKLHPQVFQMTLKMGSLQSVKDPAKSIPLSTLRNKTVHAIAGIGNPDRFFNDLRNKGLNIVAHPFPDHYRYQLSDINIGDISDSVIIMTEKDAIKCQSFADERHWFLPVTAELESSFSAYLSSILLK